MNRALLLLKQQRRSMCQGCRTFFDAYLRNISKPKSFKAKATRARKRADDAKERAERAEASRKLRAEVFARPGFDCEMGAHNGMNDYMQLCHLIAGPAKRALQKVSNCVRGCIYCHGRWHTIGPEEFRENILALCAANGYPLPPCFLREPRAPLRAPKASAADAQAPESLPERIAK